MNKHTQTTQHQLIEGVFSSEDARSILMALIEYKIQFHEQDSWSQKERFGITDEPGARRISELQTTKANLVDVIDAAGLAHKRLAIQCTIEVTPVPE
ncbi:hypothetical protein [Saccharospirillum impatiens]|uniref:hypothetical protein n=1 Tax=Saccharospirillum impatiens TaxID=169438 RepID=UPI0003F562ED|nr:hypothetical protein [Saccharospirillum impatiens]